MVRQRTVRTNEDVAGDGLAKDFDLERVGDDFLGLPVNVWVHEGDVVVACSRRARELISDMRVERLRLTSCSHAITFPNADNLSSTL